MITNPSTTGSTEFAVSAIGPQPESEFEEVDRLASALSARFEELTLIHELSQSLTLSEEPTPVIRKLLDELLPCIGAESLAISLQEDELSQSETVLEFAGRSFDGRWLDALADAVTEAAEGTSKSRQTVAMANSFDPGTGQGLHVVVVAIEREANRLGRMIAIRTANQPEFGTIEADLMKSTSTILGIHLINQRQYLQLQHMFEGMVHSLASALDAKDTYTRGHSSRVSELSVELAKRLGYSKDQTARIRLGGILHDIGKIGVDDAVLRKPARLTDDEFEQIKKHPMIGYDILKGIRNFSSILPIVRNHHESWDGSGYPDRLAGDQIPRDAQIVAVADAFDAMTSDRPYRRGMPLEKVVNIFTDGRGQQWAADVVDVLLNAPDVMMQYARRHNE